LALKQHLDDKVRFDQQVDNSKSYVMPFIAQTKELKAGVNIMEIGCGEGGVLVPFINAGCYCVGVDMNPTRIELAKGFLQQDIADKKADFLYKNVYDADFLDRFRGFFDLIILKDTIEHIPDQEKFIPYLKNFLKPDGQIYFGFPPWYMPFGGHQQICHNKMASMLPYYHILPKGMYKFLLKAFGESDAKVEELMEVRDTRISIERFEKIISNSNLKVLKKQHYLINPIYRYKFGLSPRKQWGPLTHLPFLRNFITTCVYYTVGMKS
jgi:SAM-dependent methyltransferase